MGMGGGPEARNRLNASSVLLAREKANLVQSSSSRPAEPGSITVEHRYAAWVSCDRLFGPISHLDTPVLALE